ncbi:MAG: [NiFe]-hydrogenase assembly chaperone HybE [Betaproteobacteria bacterium]|nr:[NiFe]-hydrogenase assembly chaperone HybE [Betaproteobacteria bacterium]
MSEDVALRDDPSSRLTEAFRAVAARMRGLGFVNPALEVEAVGFAPWEDCWLGVMLTPWFMNLALLPRDPARWQPLAVGEKRSYCFPAGVYEFIGAVDAIVGDYQMCSLFSPVLEFDDQATARRVAELAREALLDAQNAEPHDYPEANLAPAAPAAPGPLAGMQARVEAPMSKRDFLRGRVLGPGRESPG